MLLRRKEGGGRWWESCQIVQCAWQWIAEVVLPLLHVQPDIRKCFLVRDQYLHVDRNNISIPFSPPLIGTTFGMGPENVPP